MAAHARRHTLADTLAARRRFVGRETERALFAQALAAANPDFRVLFVHGPGGIGKSSLVGAWEADAIAAGREVIRIDARDATASSDAIVAAVATELGALDRTDPLEAIPAGAVLILDTYELLEPIDRWVRIDLVPALPQDGFLILAGRTRPLRGWREDDAIAAITRVISLRNLSADEADAFLVPAVPDPECRAALVQRSYGHPLGLALLADLQRQGGHPADEPWHPDQLETLLGSFLETVPGPSHRRALDALAIARVTTEASLRHVLGADATEVFAWLRGLSFVDTGPEGLFPHDLARDAFAADFRWRDPVGLRAVLKALLEFGVGQMLGTTGLAHQRAIMDVQHVFRSIPVLRDAWDWTTFGLVRMEAASAADRAEALALVDRWEGPASAAYAARWWDLQPENVVVVRDSFGAFRGVILTVDLAAAAPADIDADPVCAVAWAYVHRIRQPATGEKVLLYRIGVDRDHHHASSATLNMATVLTTQHVVLDPTVGWSIIAMGNRELWDGPLAFAGWPRVRGLTTASGEATLYLFAHDFGTMPVARWLDWFADRITTAFMSPDMHTPVPTTVALSLEEFTAAVKDGLRQLHRPDRLANNPLSRSRLVRDGRDLRDVLTDAVTELGSVPRGEKLRRALDRTYLRPAATQELAAELLGLPFSTYRRHLTAGIEQVVGTLWHRELYAEEK